MTINSAASMPDVSRETVERLEEFAGLITKWTQRINLISAASVPHIWDRHILDSTQLYQHAPKSWSHWADLGSGGGFPALPLAILAKELQPTAHFTLIESDQRKAALLRSAIGQLDLSATVIDQRIEAAPPLNADVLTARALGSLSYLLDASHRHLASTGRALFSKGRTVDAEIGEARAAWTFDLVNHRSLTDPEAQILQVERIARA